MSDAPAIPARTSDRQWRRPAYLGLLTLLPTAVVAWLPVLMSESFGRCLTYGEECAPGYNTLAGVAWYAFWGSAAAGVAALILYPTGGWARRARKSLVLTQLALQIVTASAILAMA
ncbi:hypothetical protein FBY35_6762 [Streptomyces sp. SLBN-118]|uniref:hypothetical protein n=1 Tax=Streptomyces sp. SLBN-118 TaxID=2768454 RepID=UPI00114D67E2|nr:hypothetical protein [Streptomyces sp. SLBN-118]TQK45209.1 hypothetical protein FBY35_6762 [Streptomyces sp. SLBN-118]